MQTLQAVVIQKRNMTIEEASRIAARITDSECRETKMNYTFNNIPRSKFEKGTLTTKKINQHVTLKYGQLKPQFSHLHGDGLFDFLQEKYNQVKDFLKPRTDGYNNRSAATLKKYGNEKITSIFLMRTPINSVVKTLLNVISLGKFEEIRTKYNFDKVFHLSLVLEVTNKKIIVEKNEVVNVSPNFTIESDSEILNIPMGGKHITLNELMETTRKSIGNDRFFMYDAFGGKNCQNFIDDILKSNGLSTSQSHNWLFQPLDELVKDLPAYVPFLSKVITDTAATANKILGGKLHKVIDKKLDQIVDKMYKNV